MAQQEGRDNAAIQAVEALEAYAVYKMGMYDLARQRWEALAAKGNATAMVNLAAMASQGQGGRRDEAAADMWLKKAADLGDARAIEELARRNAPVKTPAAPSESSAK
ncbi:MAG TPA: SEL1-like repeat protein [Azospirillaceae bacterium]|nr:SEL1-like repeat protein [Azospirillaceae bacterium]HRQ81133.1 SEL1-like repeat protein [Azospirillaceae bacterium]